MAELEAPFFRSENRAPVDLIWYVNQVSRHHNYWHRKIVFFLRSVIDQSGSMAGDKIKLTKETVSFIVRNLEKKDRLGIVSYDSNVHKILPLTQMNEKGKMLAQTKLKTIQVNSATNLAGGLLEGVKQMRDRGEQRNEVAAVMMFTDGLFLTTRVQIYRLTQSHVKICFPIHVRFGKRWSSRKRRNYTVTGRYIRIYN